MVRDRTEGYGVLVAREKISLDMAGPMAQADPASHFGLFWRKVHNAVQCCPRVLFLSALGLEPAGLVMSVVRRLEPEDLAILELAPAPVKPTQLKKIRDSHHALARALSSGMSNVEAARITGFDSGYISILKADPAFEELLAYYTEHNEVEQANLRDRMTLIALDVSQEIRERLHNSPETFSITELRQLLTNLADRVGFGPSATVHQTMDITENLSYADQRVLADALKAIEAAGAREGRSRIIGPAEPGEASGPLIEAEPIPSAPEDLQPLPERGSTEA